MVVSVSGAQSNGGGGKERRGQKEQSFILGLDVLHQKTLLRTAGDGSSTLTTDNKTLTTDVGTLTTDDGRAA